MVWLWPRSWRDGSLSIPAHIKRASGAGGPRGDVSEEWWRHLGSSQKFSQKIVERMGKTFYRRVFQPALRRAWREGKKYEEIRDEFRVGWNARREGG
jgi:hypothetical protein